MCKGTIRKIMSYMMEKPDAVTHATDWLMVGDALERAAILTAGISEHVIYRESGMDIRHITR
jgi:hypothetical protein